MAAFAAGMPAMAADITEIHLQYGELKNLSFQGGGASRTFIATLHHVSQWRYGDVFLFIDQVNRRNDSDVYTEAYGGLSLGKITGRKIGFGPIRDTGPRLGINWGADTRARRYLPGWRLSWDMPGFRAFNTDFYWFIDDGAGVQRGGIPKQSDSWQADWNFVYPFKLGSASFSVEGHFEYTGRRRTELGVQLARTVLGQPQFRYDLGEGVFGQAGKLFAGIEMSIWLNKQGDAKTNESRVQALLAWRF